LGLIEGHCHHDARNIDKTRSNLKHGFEIAEGWNRDR
jgi:hypothetical protein